MCKAGAHFVQTGRGFDVSVYQLKNKRWRVQVRRQGFPALDAVFATKGEASLRQAQFETECAASSMSICDWTIATWISATTRSTSPCASAD